MPKDYVDAVQYRRRVKSTDSFGLTWTTVTTDGTSPLTFSPALATGYEYEFRIVRTRGAQSANSATNTNNETYFSNSVNLDLGGSISSPGTFLLTGSNGQADVTFTRTRGNSNSLQLKFSSANWDWVGVSYGSPTVRYCASNDNTPPATQTDGTNTFTTDATKIDQVDNKTVQVKLASSVTFTLLIRYNGNSSGTININGL